MQWQCFDACPVTACLGDYTAARLAAMAPDAKLIFMLRDPVSAAFSAELMLRNLGVPLDWSWTEDLKVADPRFVATPDDEAFWASVAALGPHDPLPADLPRRLFTTPCGVLRCGAYADRIAPFLRHFKREKRVPVAGGWPDCSRCLPPSQACLAYPLHPSPLQHPLHLLQRVLCQPAEDRDEVCVREGGWHKPRRHPRCQPRV